MIKRVIMAVLVLVALTACGLVSASKEGSWTGQINDSMCGAKNVDATCAAKCVNDHGAKYVFVNDGDNKVYNLEPQDKIAAHAGHHVVVKGKVDGDTITVMGIVMPAAKK